jgi:hypothetical protein
MKRSITLTTVMIIFTSMLAVGLAMRSAGLVPKVHAQNQHQQGCSLATLYGSYLVTGTGIVLPENVISARFRDS